MSTQSRPSSRVSARPPHHESPTPNDLAIQKPSAPPENKRLSEVVAQDEANAKRVSLFSTSSASNRKTYVGPWQLGKTIGRGGCSSVRMVRNKYTAKVCAAKIISKVAAEQARAMSLANLEKTAGAKGAKMIASGKVMPFGLEREIVIMKLLDHPNIVHLYDVWENRNELYLVMEYVEGGELFDFIQANPCIDEQSVVYIYRQLVGALLYCHRMSIFHRDLKPENILLDRNTYQIKLVDFGMAALQPEGRFLKTPCGSPHYAAPELLQYKPYEGTKVDTWSSGVILFVMLAGTPPFNYPPNAREMTDSQRMHALYDTIIAARYRIPVGFSAEAEDLIKRIFVADPNKRISLAEVWDHPLMHKYDEALGYKPDDLERLMGPPPSLEAWVPLNRHTIDRDLFRNLRTLWHDVKESELAAKLLNQEANIEKYFYLRLMESREEQLENYAGYPDGISYSASDYHHLKPSYPRSPFIPPSSQSSQSSVSRPVRSKSQYSILNDEHLKSRLSLHNNPSSEASYDPFRASRDPIEARKVSTELEAVCDQAFFKSSLSSSHVTTATSGSPYSDTPPSSVSNHPEPLTTDGDRTGINGAIFNRPLPPVPMTTPRTYAKNEVRHTRDRLAARVGEDGTEMPYYNEVMDHLNYLVGRSGSTSGYGPRATSAPTHFTKSSGDAQKLPVINEEDRCENPEDEKYAQLRKRGHRGKRAATEPSNFERNANTKSSYQQETIRLVTETSPTPIAPLNIRKKSSASTSSRHDQNDSTTAGAQGSSRAASNVPQRPASRVSKSFAGLRGKTFKEQDADDITMTKAPGVAVDQNAADLQVKKKKSFFWRKSSKELVNPTTGSPSGSQTDVDRPQSAEWESLSSTPARHGRQETGYYNTADLRGFASQTTSDSSEFELRQAEAKNPRKGKFMDFFRKKSDKSYINTNPSGLELGSDPSSSTISPSFEISFDEGNGRGLTKRPSEVNWFAKFFHIKPATRVLCFQIGRGRTRSEVVRILRGAQRIGVKDLRFSREDNIVSARIGRHNQLKIKPVTVVCEIFAVLERGHRAQLCVARFTQTKGAASSFRHVVGIMETILNTKGLLVEDEERAREMCEILG
ncbi:Pkinase-domain-containing protein [Eremomyces bilateralis CBS 781.70]|uniref:non-specific serine/threonine protein kinase n=1 Tax=Eremomyces bilateralis CBS 781.70 TaxID=1392243 RepID=A0A6G1G3I3_9PEZI|nr:Pkinase-domain-containing protein [Eremomyces bilateralis CBS 781.70]KAF1812476.1 Pkinase-domain-containing protein [Eremomyces bilateralis CBS 781.70]